MESIITITNLTICTLRLGLGVNGGWALDGAPTKTPSPKVVGDLQWFLAFKYTFESELYISSRILFKKIYELNLKISWDSHLYWKNSKTDSHVPHLELLMWSCKFSCIVKPLHMLECCKCPLLDTLTLYKWYCYDNLGVVTVGLWFVDVERMACLPTKYPFSLALSLFCLLHPRRRWRGTFKHSLFYVESDRQMSI